MVSHHAYGEEAFIIPRILQRTRVRVCVCTCTFAFSTQTPSTLLHG